MSEQKTQVFYEIHLTQPRYPAGSDEPVMMTAVYGPYATPRHVKLAIANRGWRGYLDYCKTSSMVVKKVTRVYTDTAEEVEI